MAIDPKSVPLARVSWRPSYRLIPSRFPTVGLYDAIADAADLEAVFAIEALANPRAARRARRAAAGAAGERVSGPGATPVMAAFTHLNPEGSRFSDGSYGVYYAAHSLATAVAEVSHHRAVFLRRTDEPAIDLDMRLITANVEAELHDLRTPANAQPAERPYASVLDPARLRPVAAARHRPASPGQLGHRATRACAMPSGECVAIFRPRALRHAKSALHIALHWDGERITHWFEKRAPHPLTAR